MRGDEKGNNDSVHACPTIHRAAAAGSPVVCVTV
jgi:hypothetical protein